MSITLKITHLDGMRLRQQSASRKEDGTLEWKFDPTELQQDEDPRKVDSHGKHEKLGTYTMHLTSSLKNLVVEKKGKQESCNFRNSSLRNQMRMKVQTLTEIKPVKLDEAGNVLKRAVMEWKDGGAVQYIPANQWTGIMVGDNQRAILDEMPT